MNENITAITETMEQVQKHIERYLALHVEITDDAQIMNEAIRERWGQVAPSAVLEQAEINSIKAARDKRLRDPRTNPWVDTTVQNDLFNNVVVKVPSVLIVNGKPRPYYEASIRDGLEFWRARQDAKAVEENHFREAAQVRQAEAAEAGTQADILERMAATAVSEGLDPNMVRYARTQTPGT